MAGSHARHVIPAYGTPEEEDLLRYQERRRCSTGRGYADTMTQRTIAFCELLA